jgi:hypothetical protein
MLSRRLWNHSEKLSLAQDMPVRKLLAHFKKKIKKIDQHKLFFEKPNIFYIYFKPDANGLGQLCTDPVLVCL